MLNLSSTRMRAPQSLLWGGAGKDGSPGRGGPCVPVADAPAQGLVDGPEGLDVVPLTAGQEASLPAVLVVVLPLQLNLHGAGRVGGGREGGRVRSERWEGGRVGGEREKEGGITSNGEEADGYQHATHCSHTCLSLMLG